MNNTGNVTKTTKKNVDNNVSTTATFQENAQGRENNGENYLCHILALSQKEAKFFFYNTKKKNFVVKCSYKRESRNQDTWRNQFDLVTTMRCERFKTSASINTGQATIKSMSFQTLTSRSESKSHEMLKQNNKRS